MMATKNDGYCRGRGRGRGRGYAAAAALQRRCLAVFDARTSRRPRTDLAWNSKTSQKSPKMFENIKQMSIRGIFKKPSLQRRHYADEATGGKQRDALEEENEGFTHQHEGGVVARGY